ncbi:MAG: ABC transporter ATP-binding protein [Aristaeellaceae bacterium]
MMNEPVISVRGLSKAFSGRRVVDGLSFQVQRGEVFGLLGHNGAGKSTTIDLLLGLKKPDAGEARILGMEAAGHRKQVFSRVGVQLQSTRYQPGITVEEACQEYASLYEAPADYPRLLEQFGLSALRRSLVSSLSGGERQKLSVVLALIGNPEIVFLDELTTGLDVVARREVWRTLRQLKERGLTIFLTTHYMEEAEALCDRVCIIRAGRKVAEGAVDGVIAATGRKNLEEAYLFCMGEEELL